jgi:hypothetical protein
MHIAWHVDDLKISNVDNTVVSDIIEKINKVHEYLGMLLNFSKKKGKG